MAKPLDPMRRQAILDCSLMLFAEKGFYGVSINGIASAANIALGSLYTYFASKEDLVNELYRIWKVRFGDYIVADIANLEGRACHKVVWGNVGRFATEHPTAFLFLETQHHASYLNETSIAHEEAINQKAHELYVDRFKLRLSPSDIQLVMSAFFGAYVQVFKAASVKRVELCFETFAKLEQAAWNMATMLGDATGVMK